MFHNKKLINFLDMLWLLYRSVLELVSSYFCFWVKQNGQDVQWLCWIPHMLKNTFQSLQVYLSIRQPLGLLISLIFTSQFSLHQSDCITFTKTDNIISHSLVFMQYWVFISLQSWSDFYLSSLQQHASQQPLVSVGCLKFVLMQLKKD